MRRFVTKILVMSSVALMLVSCNGTKYVSDGELLLTGNRITSSDPSVEVSSLMPYLKQQPNTKWFSSLKIPLGIYSMSGRDTTRFYNRWLKNWGEPPVTLDADRISESCDILRTTMQNRGYLDAEVTALQDVKDKRVKINYNIAPGKQYTLRKLRYNIADDRLDSILHASGMLNDGLHENSPFAIDALHAERKRITKWLNDNGFMYFNKDAITFMVDSCKSESYVDVIMNVGLYRHSSNENLRNHPRFTIGKVEFTAPAGEKLKLRPRTLDINTLVRQGDFYSAENTQKTYNKFARLQAVRSTNIHFGEKTDSSTLFQRDRTVDATIQVSRRKQHSISLQPEGTNTAGDFGAALAMTYENRNVFHGSETFSLQARGAYEAIRGLEGYNNNDFVEYSVEGKLTFPEFVIPGVTRDFLRRHNATTELVVSYNRQNRPEFDRHVFTAGWKYRWHSSTGRNSYVFDFLDVDYVSMPWISDTFKHDYLDDVSNRNAILRYNYENLFIMKMGFGITFSNQRNSLKMNVETAGNVLGLCGSLFDMEKNADGQRKVFDVAFAQYVKLDADYTHLVKLDGRNDLALHARVGFAVPYGNSTILPFEKRYFSGGANSVRGWSVRTLGPGKYRGTDGRIDFINQTGDMKIDLNAELRTKLFWKFQGALFLDAGNVWTLRNYDEQPGGQFTVKSIYDEMAVAYGIGIRLLYDYFVLRLDLGMKAVNPAFENSREHFPLLHPIFKRDYALHFAVGMPF